MDEVCGGSVALHYYSFGWSDSLESSSDHQPEDSFLRSVTNFPECLALFWGWGAHGRCVHTSSSRNQRACRQGY